MAPEAARAGVCIIRVERLGSDLLITIHSNLNVEHPLEEQVELASDVETGIRLIRKFLERYLREDRVR
jgi:hypothetical protein